EQRVRVLAAREAHHHAIPLADHRVVLDRAADRVAQARRELVALVFLLARVAGHASGPAAVGSPLTVKCGTSSEAWGLWRSRLPSRSVADAPAPSAAHCAAAVSHSEVRPKRG